MADVIHKILFLQSTSEMGGSDVSLYRIVRGLDRSRFQAVVALPHEGPFTGKLLDAGASVRVVPEMLKLTSRRGVLYFLRYLGNYPFAVARLCDLIRREGIDVVHTNSLHNLYGFMAARLTGRRHVWHVREIVWQSGLIRALETSLARAFSHKIIAISRAVAAMFAGKSGTPPENLEVLPNFVDAEELNPEGNPQVLLGRLNIAPKTPTVGVVGRLDYWKGVDDFIKAVSICRKQFPHARFLIIGGPVEGRESVADELMALASRLKLDDVVVFAGAQTGPHELRDVYAALDAVVLASSQPEPFGLVVIEAMACGKPVIATNHGGPPEIVQHGVTGWLVPPASPKELAAAICGLLADPDRAKKMGRAGRARVVSQFNQPAYMKRLQEIYEDVLGRK